MIKDIFCTLETLFDLLFFILSEMQLSTGQEKKTYLVHPQFYFQHLFGSLTNHVKQHKQNKK